MMGKLGISLYPEKSTFEKDQEYLKVAKSYGYNRVFLSFLQLYFYDKDVLLPKYESIIKEAKKQNFEVFVDVVPFIFELLEVPTDDLEYFNNLGIDGLRLDMGFSGKQEAALTHNPYSIKIEINMSMLDSHLESIFEWHPNKENLVGCHNFFPQKFTGLDENHFIECSEKFREFGISTAAFVSAQSGTMGPWPVHEGLCTLELQRTMTIQNQVRYMKQTGVIDDILIGEAYASEEELKAASLAFSEEYVVLEVITRNDLQDIEKEILDKTHEYRADRSSYMIRSSNLRFEMMNRSIPNILHNQINTCLGDILVMNDDYGQYKSELQVTLETHEIDERINILGALTSDSKKIMKLLAPRQQFRFKIIGNR